MNDKQQQQKMPIITMYVHFLLMLLPGYPSGLPSKTNSDLNSYISLWFGEHEKVESTIQSSIIVNIMWDGWSMFNMGFISISTWLIIMNIITMRLECMDIR
uniref:Uncharacterized protein n=1 Tax=Glossina palpalis gambiensis TaxID=67801 RepID=A0A1B0BQJ0_9MUSC